jgi:hypothetical protein
MGDNSRRRFRSRCFDTKEYRRSLGLSQALLGHLQLGVGCSITRRRGATKIAIQLQRTFCYRFRAMPKSLSGFVARPGKMVEWSEFSVVRVHVIGTIYLSFVSLEDGSATCRLQFLVHLFLVIALPRPLRRSQPDSPS